MDKSKKRIKDSKSVDKAGKDNKSLGQFAMGEKLGEGMFGKVRLGTHILTGEKVAIKLLEKMKILEQADKVRVEREIRILKQMKHNNIIQLYSVIQTSTTIYLVMEYSPGKELFDYIVNKRRLQESEACEFFQQVVSGVDYMHKNRICHRDLKPENMLLDSNRIIKIIDFGLSNSYGKNELLGTACGSPCYAAPEMIAGNKYSGLKIDIWSMGIILYAMVCGYLPFEDTNNDALYKKILEGKFAVPSFVSDSCKDLIKKILTVDHNKRLTIQQIRDHPWFGISSPYLSEGLLINSVVIPIDEEVVSKLTEFDFSKEEIRCSVLSNKHNHITTAYYLMVKSKIKKEEPSVSDLMSQKYLSYIHDKRNLLSNYDNDINVVVETLASSKGKFIDPERKEKKKKKKGEDDEDEKDSKLLEQERQKERELERQKEIERKKETVEVKKYGFHKQNTYMDVTRKNVMKDDEISELKSSSKNVTTSYNSKTDDNLNLVSKSQEKRTNFKFGTKKEKQISIRDDSKEKEKEKSDLPVPSLTLSKKSSKKVDKFVECITPEPIEPTPTEIPPSTVEVPQMIVVAEQQLQPDPIVIRKDKESTKGLSVVKSQGKNKLSGTNVQEVSTSSNRDGATGVKGSNGNSFLDYQSSETSKRATANSVQPSINPMTGFGTKFGSKKDSSTNNAIVNKEALTSKYGKSTSNNLEIVKDPESPKPKEKEQTAEAPIEAKFNSLVKSLPNPLLSNTGSIDQENPVANMNVKSACKETSANSSQANTDSMTKPIKEKEDLSSKKQKPKPVKQSKIKSPIFTNKDRLEEIKPEKDRPTTTKASAKPNLIGDIPNIDNKNTRNNNSAIKVEKSSNKFGNKTFDKAPENEKIVSLKNKIAAMKTSIKPMTVAELKPSSAVKVRNTTGSVKPTLKKK